MRKALSTIVQYVVFLGLGFGIIYHMLHELTATQINELLDSIKSVNLWFLLPILICGFFSHFFRAIRWRYLLDTIDLSPTLTNTFLAVMIGYITNLALPRAGEVAKCTVLAKYEKLPAHKMIGTIVAERAFDIFCLLIIGVFALLIQINHISNYVSDKVQQLFQDIKSHEVILSIVLVLFIVAMLLLIRFYRRHRETKFGKFVKEMSNGVLSIFRMKKKWQFLGYTFLIWLMYLLQIYLGLVALPATHSLSISVALVVLIYGSVGLIVTPGGIGTYTYLVAQILEVYDVPVVHAQAFGWIAWAVQTILILILGIVSLLLIHPYNKKRNAQAGLDRA